MTAKPIASSIRLTPGPEVAVIDLAPVHEAPITLVIEAISSSYWTYAPPTSGIRIDIHSAISVAGVMGYPPKYLHPALSAPSAQAISPIVNMTLSGI
jgi:hypothetical protein